MKLSPEKGTPKLVRGRCDVGTTLIRRKWGALNDRIKVVRNGIIQINKTEIPPETMRGLVKVNSFL